MYIHTFVYTHVHTYIHTYPTHIHTCTYTCSTWDTHVDTCTCRYPSCTCRYPSIPLEQTPPAKKLSVCAIYATPNLDESLKDRAVNKWEIQ